MICVRRVGAVTVDAAASLSAHNKLLESAACGVLAASTTWSRTVGSAHELPRNK